MGYEQRAAGMHPGGTPPRPPPGSLGEAPTHHARNLGEREQSGVRVRSTGETRRVDMPVGPQRGDPQWPRNSLQGCRPEKMGWVATGLWVTRECRW